MFGDKKEGAGLSADTIDPASAGKISDDVAAAEFVSYCEANDIDYDEKQMDEDDQKDFLAIKKRFIKACKQGRVIVEGQSVIYTNSDFSPKGYAGEKVKIFRPGGHAFSSMDGFKDTQSIHKLQAFCSAMTSKEVKYFSKLDISDWRFYRDIATLFFAG